MQCHAYNTHSMHLGDHHDHHCCNACEYEMGCCRMLLLYAVYGVVWCCMACMVLYGVYVVVWCVWCCMVLYGVYGVVRCVVMHRVLLFHSHTHIDSRPLQTNTPNNCLSSHSTRIFPTHTSHTDQPLTFTATSPVHAATQHQEQPPAN